MRLLKRNHNKQYLILKEADDEIDQIKFILIFYYFYIISFKQCNGRQLLRHYRCI